MVLNKLKVIVCTDGIFPYEVGGMQRHSRLLIEELAMQQCIELIVLHPHDHQVFEPALQITEIKIQPISKEKNYLMECYKYSKRIYQVLLKHPDAIIYSQGLSVWHGIKKLKAPVIINPHGLEPYQGITLKDKISGAPFRVIFNYLFRSADAVVSLGGKLTGIIERQIGASRKNKLVVLPNAVTVEPFNKNKEWVGKLKLLFLARFAANKGIHILLEAIKQLNQEGYEDKLEFNLGGKGPLFQHYSTTANYKNVHYLGFVSDEQLTELYKTNHLFVFPTLFEGMPTVALEAMSHCMPVVVSDVGATSVLVDSADKGFLIKKNDVSEVKAAILRFYNFSDDQKRAMSQHAYMHVATNFTWKRVAQQHKELFESIRKIV
ncbi:MAG TPA: glycosyltransferase family 4 protein [Bacteroidia bacterium]|jgi:glycosyltransferase involved in cell wall biosynthesis|nr:glycosyltransferase family 4 protein [Bacteroidia bacterium]